MCPVLIVWPRASDEDTDVFISHLFSCVYVELGQEHSSVNCTQRQTAQAPILAPPSLQRAQLGFPVSYFTSFTHHHGDILVCLKIRPLGWRSPCMDEMKLISHMD